MNSDFERARWCRQNIWYRYQHGEPVVNIARHIGLSRSRVWQIINKARQERQENPTFYADPDIASWMVLSVHKSRRWIPQKYCSMVLTRDVDVARALILTLEGFTSPGRDWLRVASK